MSRTVRKREVTYRSPRETQKKRQKEALRREILEELAPLDRMTIKGWEATKHVR